jgi:hypothetical protein
LVDSREEKTNPSALVGCAMTIPWLFAGLSDQLCAKAGEKRSFALPFAAATRFCNRRRWCSIGVGSRRRRCYRWAITSASQVPLRCRAWSFPLNCGLVAAPRGQSRRSSRCGRRGVDVARRVRGPHLEGVGSVAEPIVGLRGSTRSEGTCVQLTLEGATRLVGGEGEARRVAA